MVSHDATAGTPQPAAREPSRLLYRLLALLLGILAALVLAEIAFRLAGLGEPRIMPRELVDTQDDTVRYHCYTSNPNGEFQPVPEVVPGRHELRRYQQPPDEIPLERISETPWCVRYSIPSLHLRGAPIHGPPPPGVQRIMLVGDSFVFGDGVPDEKTLSVQLGAELGSAQQVINCGSAGSNLGGYILILDAVLPLYTPSRVVLVCIANDIHVTQTIEDGIDPADDLVVVRPELVHDDEARPWWARVSRIADAAYEARRLRQLARGTLNAYLDAHDPVNNPVGVEEARTTFGDLRRIRDEKGIPVAVVVYPLMYRPGGEYPLAPAHARLVALAREAQLPVLDLADAFRGLDPDDLHVHPVDHHPNGRANGIAAKRIAEWLRDDVPGFLEHD